MEKDILASAISRNGVEVDRWRVGVFIFEDVEVLDFAGPFEVFSRTRLEPGTDSRRSDEAAPFDVFTIAPKRTTLRAAGGLEVLPTFGFDDAPHIDLLVVPGGFGTRDLLNNPPVIDWLRTTAIDAHQVTSVCTGSLLLARAGLLQGCRATTHWAALDLLAEIDPSIDVCHDERVVDDGVISSAGVAAGIDMALTVVEKKCGVEVAVETARYIEYPWHRAG